MQMTIYTVAKCPYCKHLKHYLEEKGTQYKEVLLDQNPDKVVEMKKFSGDFSGVPFIVIEDEKGAVKTIKGFNRKELER